MEFKKRAKVYKGEVKYGLLCMKKRYLASVFSAFVLYFGHRVNCEQCEPVKKSSENGSDEKEARECVILFLAAGAIFTFTARNSPVSCWLKKGYQLKR